MKGIAMGNPSDPGDNGYDEGQNCPECWGPGRPFGDIPTPKKVTATFAGVAHCTAGWVPDGEYVLTQPAPPSLCTWDLVFDGVLFRWTWGAPVGMKISVELPGDPPSRYFFDQGIDCETSFVNDYIFATCGFAFQVAFGGTCVIT